MQSSKLGGKRTRACNPSTSGSVLAGLLVGALLVSGCLASQTASMQLSMHETSGDLTIQLTLTGGQLTDTQAWWSQEAPEASFASQQQVEAWEAVVLKNDVVLDREPVFGSQDEAVFVWSTSDVGTGVSPGDSFEVLIVNATEGGTIASYGLEITA